MFFVHFEDRSFERFGGVYVPYSTLAEAERQVANDLKYVENDPSAIGLMGVFEAEYGSHKIGGRDDLGVKVYDYNSPTGHLDPNKRKKLLDVKQLVANAPKHQAAIEEEEKVATVDYLLDLNESAKRGTNLKNVVPGNAYTVCSGGTSTAGAIALSAATAKTVIGVAVGSNNAPSLVEFAVSFDGVTASAVPVLVESVSGTNATNPPGTNSTSMTPKQLRGVTSASVQTAAYNWTSEPTVLEVYKKRLLTPNGGLIVIQYPLGREPTGSVTAATQWKFFGFRLTAPAAVNGHVDLEFEE